MEEEIREMLTEEILPGVTTLAGTINLYWMWGHPPGSLYLSRVSYQKVYVIYKKEIDLWWRLTVRVRYLNDSSSVEPGRGPPADWSYLDPAEVVGHPASWE